MSDTGDTRLLGFRLGGASAALPLGIVREVTERPRIVRVPGSHPFVRGVTLFGGVALPVYDLRRFDPLWSGHHAPLPAGRPADAVHLIVCDWGEVALGLLGDQVDLVAVTGPDAGGGDAGEATCGMSRTYVKRVMRSKGESIALLDADRLFTSLGVPAAEPRGRRGAGEDDSAGR